MFLAAATARLPTCDTVYWYFQRWNAEGTTDRIHDALRAAVRDDAGRDPMASAGIVDAQSVKGADTVPAASRGFDAGKKVNGRKRHVVVDTLGLLVVVLVTAASMQDRDGGRLVLARARMAMPSVVLVWADGGYAGRCVAFVRQLLRITLQIVRKHAPGCKIVSGNQARHWKASRHPACHRAGRHGIAPRLAQTVGHDAPPDHGSGFETKRAVGDHLGTIRPARGQTPRTSTGRAHGAGHHRRPGQTSTPTSWGSRGRRFKSCRLDRGRNWYPPRSTGLSLVLVLVAADLAAGTFAG